MIKFYEIDDHMCNEIEGPIQDFDWESDGEEGEVVRTGESQKAKRRCKKFTPEEDEMIRDLKEKNLTWKEIAVFMKEKFGYDRSHTSIKSRWNYRLSQKYDDSNMT